VTELVQTLLPSLTQSGLGPCLATVRLLTMITFAAWMLEVRIPWRFGIPIAALLGWVAGARPMETRSVGLAWLFGAEAVFGAALGLSAGGLLMGLKLAGELLDDRLRLADAAAAGWTDDAEPSGPGVRLLGGLAVLLCVFGGSPQDWPMLSGMLGSFSARPPGTLVEASVDWRMVSAALGGGIDLAMRTALPTLSVLAIVDWCQLLVARAAPTAPSALAATAVKPLLGLAVLVGTFGGAMDGATVAIERLWK
jgi:flagellar biosynthesis protein FliR